MGRSKNFPSYSRIRLSRSSSLVTFKLKIPAKNTTRKVRAMYSMESSTVMVLDALCGIMKFPWPPKKPKRKDIIWVRQRLCRKTS